MPMSSAPAAPLSVADQFLEDAHRSLSSAVLAMRSRLTNQVTHDLPDGRIALVLQLSQRLGALEHLAHETGRLIYRNPEHPDHPDPLES